MSYAVGRFAWDWRYLVTTFLVQWVAVNLVRRGTGGSCVVEVLVDLAECSTGGSSVVWVGDPERCGTGKLCVVATLSSDGIAQCVVAGLVNCVVCMVRPGMVRPGMVRPGMVRPGMVRPGMVIRRQRLQNS